MVSVNVLIKIACEQALFSLYSLGAVEAKIAFLFTLFRHYHTLYSLSDFLLTESPQSILRNQRNLVVW